MALCVRADRGVRVGETTLDVLLCLSEVEHIVLEYQVVLESSVKQLSSSNVISSRTKPV
jgi:hypothetical protein